MHTFTEMLPGTTSLLKLLSLCQMSLLEASNLIMAMESLVRPWPNTKATSTLTIPWDITRPTLTEGFSNGPKETRRGP